MGSAAAGKFERKSGKEPEESKGSGNELRTPSKEGGSCDTGAAAGAARRSLPVRGREF